MGRIVRQESFRNIPIDSIKVAPHRYLWTGSSERPADYGECRRAAPYQERDVVYIDIDGRPVRALVYVVFCEKDRWGDWREAYKVQTETRKGTFSNMWTVVHPGCIQSGYRLMGLAPEMPKQTDE